MSIRTFSSLQILKIVMCVIVVCKIQTYASAKSARDDRPDSAAFYRRGYSACNFYGRGCLAGVCKLMHTEIRYAAHCPHYCGSVFDGVTVSLFHEDSN